MVRLPRVVVSCTVAADVTNNSRLSHYAGALAIVSVVVNLFVFCPANVSQLLYATSVNFTTAFVTKFAAV